MRFSLLISSNSNIEPILSARVPRSGCTVRLTEIFSRVELDLLVHNNFNFVRLINGTDTI